MFKHLTVVDEVTSDKTSAGFTVIDVGNPAALIREHDQVLPNVNACISCTSCTLGTSGDATCVGCSKTFGYSDSQAQLPGGVDALVAGVAA